MDADDRKQQSINDKSLEISIQTPTWLFLPEGDVLTVADSDQDDSIHLRSLASSDEATLQGKFADSIVRAIKGETTDIDRRMLSLISRQNPFLTGLDQASSKPQSLKSLVLGQEPGICFIELTARCNERCLHCYAESEPEREEHLSLDEICAALDDLRKLGRPLVQFTGGDPLISKDIVAVVKHAAALDFADIEIYTNGLLLTDTLLEKLLPFKPRFAFSVYSHDADTHDLITRLPGSHQRTMAAIQRAKDAELVVRANAVIMTENMGHERHIQKFLHEQMDIPWNMIGFDTVKQMGRGDFFDYQLDIDYHNPTHRPNEAAEPEQAESTAAMPEEKMRTGKLCISSNGDLYPCIFSRTNRLGNIREKGLFETMQNLDRQYPVRAPKSDWQTCVESLTCYDCRIVSYALGATDLEQAG